MSGCTSRNEPVCAAALAAPGTGATPSSFERCAALYGSEDCGSVTENRYPQGCAVPGSLAAGSPCGDDSQCSGQKAYCKITTDQVCGTCATMGAAGVSCVNDKDCDYGLVCALVCTVPVAVGATCDGVTRVCPGSILCVNGTCVQPAAQGAACDPSADVCDGTRGLHCDRQSHQCVEYTTVALGASCTDPGVSCANGACSTQGTCVANAADGASCNVNAGGPFCNSPAACVKGACVAPNASSCQ